MQSLQQQQQPQLLSKQISPQFDFSNCNHQSVSDFLNHCHLNQYLDVFLLEGFDSVTSLLEITEEDMIFMNVKRGHRRLIQREIATTKGIPRDQPLITNIMGAKYPIDVTHSPTTTTTTTTTTNQKIPMNDTNNSYTNNSLMKLNNENSHGYETALASPRSMNSGIGGSGSSSSSGPMTLLRSRSQQPQQQQNEKPGFLSNDSAHCSSSNNNLTPNNTNNNNNNNQVTISDNRSNSISSNDDNDSIDTNESAPLKRKYRRHAKPDRHAPIKPPSAYIMFSNDARAELKNQNLSFAELAKIVGDQWKNLSHHEKQAYERMAMRAKDEYLASLEQYRQTPQYSRYQEYLNDFKSKQDAANRLIGRARKRAKQASPGSGSIADSSSNGNSHGSGSSGSGSTDAYGDKDSVMRRQRVPSDSESPENGEYELEKPTRPSHRPQHQQSSDSGYASQSYYNNQPTEQWNFRSNQIMRGMLPVEFVHNEKNKDQDELLEDESQYDSTKRRSPRFYKTTTS